MRVRKAEDIRKSIDSELSGVRRDPFLYQRVLNKAQEEQPRRRPRKLTVALVMLVLLALTTATGVATNWVGVRYFLTNRRALPVTVVETGVAHPTSQSSESDTINLRVLDAYWYADPYGDRLDMTIHVDVQDPEKAFCMDTDIGTDGESFDKIWWNGSVQQVSDWLDGREGYALFLTQGTLINGRQYWGGLDWIHEAQGMTMLLDVRDVPDLTGGATVVLEGWTCPIVPDEGELGHRTLYDDMTPFTLTFTLPPMTQGPAREIDDDNEPNR